MMENKVDNNIPDGNVGFHDESSSVVGNDRQRSIESSLLARGASASYIDKYGPQRKLTTNDGEEPNHREIYVPDKLKSGEEVISQRKTLNQRPGFNFEELYRPAVKVSGENAPKPCKKFEEFGFSEQLLQNVKRCGYTRPTPIQEHVIPIMMAGRDVMSCGQTGSGKTASYLLPIVNGLCNSGTDQGKQRSLPANPKALILSPVRELAIQIATESQMYVGSTGISSTVVYGGTSTSAELRELKNNHDIVVATPGRLLQLIFAGNIHLDRVRFFVLDEADRMLDDGFFHDIYEIIKFMPPLKQRVTAMFSATFPAQIQKLANKYLDSYLFVVVGTIGGASYDVDQEFEVVEHADKYFRLQGLLNDTSAKDKILIFCETRLGAQDLSDKLSAEGLNAVSIHGERFQSEREKALREFTEGKKQILVATAVAARGLDIPRVTHVVNYDLPSNIDEYVQQIGRTGRVGNKGKAISFFEINRDAPMASKLISILRSSMQSVPKILESINEEEHNRFDGKDGADMFFPSSDVRLYNSIGSRPRGVPLPCEVYAETWD